MSYRTVPGADADRVELVWHNGSLAVVSLVGEHDLVRHQPLKEALRAAAARRQHVLVDLSECVFLDSTVISSLLHTHGLLTSRNGSFALIVPPESTHTARVVNALRLDQALRIHPSLEAALTSVADIEAAR
jgi:anti-anti-sigma factor